MEDFLEARYARFMMAIGRAQYTTVEIHKHLCAIHAMHLQILRSMEGPVQMKFVLLLTVPSQSVQHMMLEIHKHLCAVVNKLDAL